MEVKDKLTTLESLKVAYDANRESINTLSEELLAQMGDVAQQSDVDALNARVTNLELNAGGDSNAEVVDARVSNSGTTYGTLKERLDEEYNQLTKELENGLSQLSEDVNSIKQNGTGTGSGVTVPTFLNGLKYYALGDSIVDNQGTTALPETFGSIGYTNDLQGNNISDITVKGYIQAIEEKYGLVCTNYGKAGHTIVGDFSTIMALDYSDVALVTIAYGVNDARTGVTLGTVNSTDGTTFAGALNQILRKIYTDNPECRVIVLTPLQRLYVSEFGIATPNANGDYLIDFVDMCKKVAQKRSTRCIDMYRDSGINQTNLYFYTVEGVHPLNPCYLRMAMPILKTLEEMTLLEFEPFGTMTNTGDTEPDEPDTGGSGSTEEPPTEDDSATTVELTEDMFTVNGMYYDAWGSIFGQNTYHGTEAIENIVGKTYTLITYLATDGAYFGVTCDSADFTTHKGKSFNCNLIGTTSEETIDGTVYKRVEYTWVAEVPYVFIAKKKEVPVSYCSLSYV